MKPHKDKASLGHEVSNADVLLGSSGPKDWGMRSIPQESTPRVEPCTTLNRIPGGPLVKGNARCELPGEYPYVRLV